METSDVIQTREVRGRLKIHFVDIAVAGFGNRGIQEVRERACHQHGDAHHENPYQQLHLHGRDP